MYTLDYCGDRWADYPAQYYLRKPDGAIMTTLCCGEPDATLIVNALNKDLLEQTYLKEDDNQ